MGGCEDQVGTPTTSTTTTTMTTADDESEEEEEEEEWEEWDDKWSDHEWYNSSDHPWVPDWMLNEWEEDEFWVKYGEFLAQMVENLEPACREFWNCGGFEAVDI